MTTHTVALVTENNRLFKFTYDSRDLFDTTVLLSNIIPNN